MFVACTNHSFKFFVKGLLKSIMYLTFTRLDCVRSQQLRAVVMQNAHFLMTSLIAGRTVFIYIFSVNVLPSLVINHISFYSTLAFYYAGLFGSGKVENAVRRRTGHQC